MNLSTIGRADPIGSLRRMQMDDQAITLNKQKKAINDLTIQNQKQNLQVKQSQIDNKAAKQKELDTVIPWETFVTTFADQGEGEIGKFVTSLAQKTGLLGKDGLFSKRKQGKLAKILATPKVSAQLSNKRVEYAANVFRNAKKSYLEKPDEKTKAALESATNNYNAAVGSNKNLKDGLQALKKTSTKYQASSKIAKLNNDLKNGLITQEEYINAKNNLYESKQTKNITDIDDYVERFRKQYILDNGEPPSPGLENEAALKFKRAQAEERKAVRLAEKTVDAQTAQIIKRNEKIGTMLGEIEYASQLIDAKGEITPSAKKNAAKKRMSGTLATLANHYVTLASSGAMLDVSNSSFENIMAATRSSDLGQMFGRITGTNEQSIRNSIKKIKPLLIQDIRQSTDMGARGLDSEKELEFYLQAATDEKTDIQSNIAAIVVLDEAFGDGNIANKLRGLTNKSLITRIANKGSNILNNKKSDIINELPPGSKLIGTSDGRKVYQTSDGKQFIEE